MSCVICHLLCVIYHVSCVKCKKNQNKELGSRKVFFLSEQFVYLKKIVIDLILSFVTFVWKIKICNWEPKSSCSSWKYFFSSDLLLSSFLHFWHWQLNVCNFPCEKRLNASNYHICGNYFKNISQRKHLTNKYVLFYVPRGFSGVHRNLVVVTNIDRTSLLLNLGFRPENFMFTGDGFNVNSGFRKCLFSQEIDSMLIQLSQKIGVNQTIHYRPPSWKTKQYISCTLRSGLHEIPTMIRAFSDGLENNQACKWISGNCPGMLTYVLFLKNCLKSICMPGCSLIHVERTVFFLKVWDR